MFYAPRSFPGQKFDNEVLLRGVGSNLALVRQKSFLKLLL